MVVSEECKELFEDYRFAGDLGNLAGYHSQ